MDYGRDHGTTSRLRLCCREVHVEEPYELRGEQGLLFWEEAMRVAEAVARTIVPEKMNYEIHGNTIRHLHMHLFPRMSGDPFEDRPIDAGHLEFSRTAAELEPLPTRSDASDARRRSAGPAVHAERQICIDCRAGLMTKIERERFTVSLRLVGWLALHRDDRPDSLHMKVGLGRVPEVEALIAAIVWESGDGQVTG